MSSTADQNYNKHTGRNIVEKRMLLHQNNFEKDNLIGHNHRQFVSSMNNLKTGYIKFKSSHEGTK